MGQKQNNKNSLQKTLYQHGFNYFNNDLIFFIVLFFIITGLFVLLTPKISSRLFPFVRQARWNSFITQTLSEGNINPQKFWEFREFYSPGYYTFDRNGLDKLTLSKAQNIINIPLNIQYIDRFFITFTSPQLTSIEALTTANNLSKVVNLNSLNKNFILLSKKNQIIYKNKQTVYLFFLKTNKEMKTANGFFDYNNQDKNIIKGKCWLDITMINLQ